MREPDKGRTITPNHNNQLIETRRPLGRHRLVSKQAVREVSHDAPAVDSKAFRRDIADLLGQDMGPVKNATDLWLTS
ncbi:MAG: hypothetical protein E7Z97_09835 [Propionibacteriaceae bacterium]|nr:hypothetical protein [Propionibacteriaceae bacterium]